MQKQVIRFPGCNHTNTLVVSYKNSPLDSHAVIILIHELWYSKNRPSELIKLLSFTKKWCLYQLCIHYLYVQLNQKAIQTFLIGQSLISRPSWIIAQYRSMPIKILTLIRNAAQYQSLTFNADLSIFLRIPINLDQCRSVSDQGIRNWLVLTDNWGSPVIRILLKTVFAMNVCVR